MYVTAQRVRAEDGQEGIHSFCHQHGAVEWPQDVSGWPESNPGRLVAVAAPGPRLGGNRVRSYLDVLGPDGTETGAIEAALAALEGDLEERRNPTVFRHGAVTIRLGVELGLEAVRGDELTALAGPVLAILEQAPLAYRTT